MPQPAMVLHISELCSMHWIRPGMAQRPLLKNRSCLPSPFKIQLVGYEECSLRSWDVLVTAVGSPFGQR